jgi:hypothetical protein
MRSQSSMVAEVGAMMTLTLSLMSGSRHLIFSFIAGPELRDHPVELP